MTDYPVSSPMDPQENPVGTGHLPVAGEVGVGAVPYHDPVTTDTNDDPATTFDTAPPPEQEDTGDLPDRLV